MIALVMFLCGIGVGGWLVWALVSFTALNPTSSALPEDWVPVRLILEREGFDTAGISAAVAAGGRHSAGSPRPAPYPHKGGPACGKGRSSYV
ncbi:hypothetical protein [Nocardia acidivorans]|uniref:hypothetical protein n=1 Tax=Nocardia acidivorans TaxID=404580 RepID=UPI000AF78F4F|nr:hypothetical protein [Nocardia acidivorans]